MSNPLMNALVSARLQEHADRQTAIHAAIAGEVAKLNAQHGVEPEQIDIDGDDTRLLHFATWCDNLGIPALPASPATVGLFIWQRPADHLADTLAIVGAVSRAHQARGLADPTLGYAVTSIVNHLASIDPPRSWPKAEHQTFKSLPIELQRFLVKREKERDREVRRVQNDAARNKGKTDEAKAA